MWVTNEFYLLYFLTSKVINDHHERLFGIIIQADVKGGIRKQSLQGRKEVKIIGGDEVFELVKIR